jgi:hypothetical protein
MATRKAKATTTFPAKVEKVITPHPHSGEPEKAQISVLGADDLYREIRFPNRLTDEDGNQFRLKQGEHIEVTIHAHEEALHIVSSVD